MAGMNCGFYQVKICSRTDSPLLSWWSGRLNSSAPERRPKLIAVNVAELQGETAIKPCNARVSPGYNGLIMMVRTCYISSAILSRYFLPSTKQVGESDISTASNRVRGDLADPVRALRHNRQLQCTNKHLKHDPPNNQTTLFCSVGLLLSLCLL